MLASAKNKHLALPTAAGALEEVVQTCVRAALASRAPAVDAAVVQSAAVLRITSAFSVFDWHQPYNTSNSQEGTGTGMVLDRVVALNPVPTECFWVLTAYHVVELSRQMMVRVQAEEETKLVTGRLVACVPELDVAIVAVGCPLPTGIEPLHCASSDDARPAQPVQALGYAKGMEHLQFTTGVISGRSHSQLQIDCAVNGGNSGGPLVAADGVVGVIVSSAVNAKGISYATPINEAIEALTRAVAARSRTIGIPSLNARFGTAARAFIDDAGVGGGLCTHVIVDSPLHRAGMRPGDLLLRLGDHVVQYDATARTHMWPLPLRVDAVAERLGADGPMEIEFWSAASRTRRTVRVTLEPKRWSFRTRWPEFERIPYCARGGVVVQPLCVAMLQDVLLRMKLSALIDCAKIKERGLAIVTHVMPDSPFRNTRNVEVGDVVVSVAGRRINVGAPYDAYVREWERWDAERSTLIAIGIRDGGLAAATRDEVRAMDARTSARQIELVVRE